MKSWTTALVDTQHDDAAGKHVKIDGKVLAERRVHDQFIVPSVQRLLSSSKHGGQLPLLTHGLP